MSKFFKNVKAEFDKVTWVKKEVAINTAAVVIALSVFVCVYISVFDFLVLKFLHGLV